MRLFTACLIMILCLCSIQPALAAEETPIFPDTQLLVNQQNPLPAYLQPENLLAVGSFARANANVRLREDAALALQNMLAALKKAGISDVFVNSGYRSYSRQAELYQAKVQSYRSQGYGEEEAQALAARWVLPPGESEHQSGLAVDLSTASMGYALNHNFANTPAGSWLAQHCREFGFIIRYTEAKEPITGVAPEPWHFRYVGVDHAHYMYAHDLCLEEYHALLREQESPLLFLNGAGQGRAVHYSKGDISSQLPGQILSVSLARKNSGEYIITTMPPLHDTMGHWAEQQIARLYEMQAINGYQDGSFHPNTGISRGEFVTILARLPLPAFIENLAQAQPENADDDNSEDAENIDDGEDAQNTEQLPLPLPYLDIDETKYYYQPLEQCFRATLVQPMTDRDAQPQLFQPEQALLRREAALILAALLEREDFQPPLVPTYKDVPPAAAPLFRAVELLTERGVLTGDGLGLFYPEREISRAETSAILIRLLDALSQQEQE